MRPFSFKPCKGEGSSWRRRSRRAGAGERERQQCARAASQSLPYAARRSLGHKAVRARRLLPVLGHGLLHPKVGRSHLQAHEALRARGAAPPGTSGGLLLCSLTRTLAPNVLNGSLCQCTWRKGREDRGAARSVCAGSASRATHGHGPHTPRAPQLHQWGGSAVCGTVAPSPRRAVADHGVICLPPRQIPKAHEKNTTHTPPRGRPWRCSAQRCRARRGPALPRSAGTTGPRPRAPPRGRPAPQGSCRAPRATLTPETGRVVPRWHTALRAHQVTTRRAPAA